MTKTGLEKLKIWMMDYTLRGESECKLWAAFMAKVNALLAEEKSTPVDEGLVEELKSFVKKYDSEGGWDWFYCEDTKGFEELANKILSRHTKGVNK